MRKWTQIIILLLSPAIVGAQSLSSKGRFSVEFNKGCAPLTVNISQLDAFGAVTRQYYYFEGANITNSTSFTYDQPGIYEIVQVVGVDNIGDKSDTLQIEVLASQQPEVLISKCSNFEISVTSIDVFYDSVRVYFGGADSTTLQLDESINYSFSTNGSQTIGLKGFFDNADEVCLSYFQETIPIPSISAPSIVSASIKETCKDVYSLYLTIDQFDPYVNYRINLDQGTPIRIFDGFLNSTSIIIPTISFSPDDYCINIEAYDPCNNFTNTSTDLCQAVNSLSLSPFETLYSSYEGGSIYINLDQVSSGTFEVYRRFEGGNLEPRTTTSGSFNDGIGTASRKYFYKIDYRDSCENILYSAETHPPFIEADLISKNEYLVRHTEAQNSLSGSIISMYEVGVASAKSTGAINSSRFDLRLNAKDGTPRQFLSASSTYDGTTVITSNTLTLKYELIVYVPSAFTPNGDGLNDTLEVFGLPTENATVRIYSKWGQLIFNSTDPASGWDGTVNGSVAQEGTYLYEITFETPEGEILRQKGTFVLIKK